MKTESLKIKYLQIVNRQFNKGILTKKQFKKIRKELRTK